MRDSPEKSLNDPLPGKLSSGPDWDAQLNLSCEATRRWRCDELAMQNPFPNPSSRWIHPRVANVLLSISKRALSPTTNKPLRRDFWSGLTRTVSGPSVGLLIAHFKSS